MLTIGGGCVGQPSGAIHCYDRDTNSWNVISAMPTPRYNVLAAVLPNNEQIVVGGSDGNFSYLNKIEIGQLEYN